MLQARDIVVLLKLVATGNSLAELEQWWKDFDLEVEELGASLRRSEAGGLYNSAFEEVCRRPFLNLLVHGVPRFFPAVPGEFGSGMPTAHAHEVLGQHLVADAPYVWPHESSHVEGRMVQPLDSLVIPTAQNDPAFYALAALVDALRVGRARDRNAAGRELELALAA